MTRERDTEAAAAEHEEAPRRQPYEPPELVVLGTLFETTKVSLKISGTPDGMSGFHNSF